MSSMSGPICLWADWATSVGSEEEKSGVCMCVMCVTAAALVHRAAVAHSVTLANKPSAVIWRSTVKFLFSALLNSCSFAVQTLRNQQKCVNLQQNEVQAGRGQQPLLCAVWSDPCQSVWQRGHTVVHCLSNLPSGEPAQVNAWSLDLKPFPSLLPPPLFTRAEGGLSPEAFHLPLRRISCSVNLSVLAHYCGFLKRSCASFKHAGWGGSKIPSAGKPVDTQYLL